MVWLQLAAGVLLVSWLVLRVAGPGDLWDQTQPRTIAYTSDMLVHGGQAFLLPRDASDHPATKPPLYNWLALPGSTLLGRDSEVAHKLPSLLGLLATLLLTAGIGERLARGVGWIAAIMLITSYPMFKLGYLARPDMLLVLALLGGWWSATRLLVGDAVARGGVRAVAEDGSPLADRASLEVPPRRWQLAFWTCVVAAAWTKGPPAVLLVAYALLGARLLTGAWSNVTRLGLGWALPALLLAMAWPAAVYLIDEAHLRSSLLGDELLGRIAGTGPEGGGRGLRGVLLGFLHMPAYAMLRFLPWCIPAVAGAFVVIAGRRERDVPRAHAQATLEGAVLWCAIAVLVFSLSSGKRADYLAPVYPMLALLGSWWLHDAMKILQRPMLVVVTAYATMAALWLGSRRAEPAPIGVQEAIAIIEQRVRGERVVMEAIDPQALLLILGTPAEHLPALVGSGRPRDSSRDGVREALLSGRTVRLVHEPMHLPEDLRRQLLEAEVDGRLRSLWRVPVPWEHLPLLAVECVEIRGNPDRAETRTASAATPSSP